MAAATHWVDRLTAPFAPRWTFQRQRARAAAELFASVYDAASLGPRTRGWRRFAGDANAAIGAGRAIAGQHARDLDRNNPWAISAADTIVNQMVGAWGIEAEDSADPIATERWTRWSGTTACDSTGRHDFAGLCKLAARTTVVSGEALVRRRWRRLSDGLPIPMQLQVLEPDHLDTWKNGLLPDGGRIVQGVEFDPLGRPRQYWLFREHPGSTLIGISRGNSVPIPASDIIHIFRSTAGRPGQVRGISWFTSVVSRFKNFDVYEDAALMKQLMAACLGFYTSDPEGTSATLGQATDDPTEEEWRPGMIVNFKPGRTVGTIQPPTVSEHGPYSTTVLRAKAAGMGISYEDLTGDFSSTSFSSSRMSRLRTWARVEDNRWGMLIPQFCEPVYLWAMEALAIEKGVAIPEMNLDRWTASPLPMIEPDREGLAYTRLIRATLMPHEEALRERGYRPKQAAAAYKRWNETMDRLGILSDADPRNTNQNGQLQGAAAVKAGTAGNAAAALQAVIEQLVDAAIAKKATEGAER